MAKPEYIDTDSTPVCPYCNRELTKIERIAAGWNILSRYINVAYLCPHCKKVLSIGGSTG